MSQLSWAAIRHEVYQRANACCEYCQTCEDNIGQALHIEHINPNGDDDLNNLCLACANCNFSKSDAKRAIDPLTQVKVTLYNPRTEKWHEHFEWIEQGIYIAGKTAIGRATVTRLKMNRDRIVRARWRWIQLGFHPPKTL